MADNHQPCRNDPADELVIAARTEGDALGRLFDLFYPLILAYCLRRLLVRAVAEDVTSEVFLKVAMHIREFAGTQIEDFRRWVFRIATNEINHQLRKSIRRRELLEAATHLGAVNPHTSAPLIGEAEVLWQDVYRAINTLSDRDQSIISLRFFAGLKHDQIADALGIKPGTVRVALARALDKLRDRLRHSQSTKRAARGATSRGN